MNARSYAVLITFGMTALVAAPNADARNIINTPAGAIEIAKRGCPPEFLTDDAAWHAKLVKGSWHVWSDRNENPDEPEPSAKSDLVGAFVSAQSGRVTGRCGLWVYFPQSDKSAHLNKPEH